MANPDHVEIFRQGKEAIDLWWDKAMEKGYVTEEEFPDLSGAELRGVDFLEAQLTGANLSDAHLEGAILVRSDLSASTLRGAHLQGANCIQANCIRADLEGADLQGCDLARANLTGATLDHSRLSSARLYETILANVGLAGAVGLQSIQHAGPSIIDERTLRKSGPLPDAFLRGVGLSDELIEYLPSLLGKAIEFYSCFISYSSKDDEFARRLHADLQENGVRCWFAPEDLRIGDKFRVRIDEAIRLHDKLLLILSQNSVGSQWVEDEVESALEKERKASERGEDRTVLFPIRLDDAVMETDAAWAASVRRARHVGDFTNWKDHDAYGQAFERLLRDLKAADQGGV